jgi:hypothetical protein
LWKVGGGIAFEPFRQLFRGESFGGWDQIAIQSRIDDGIVTKRQTFIGGPVADELEFMGVGSQDQHFNVQGQTRLTDSRQTGQKPGMGSGHTGDRVIGGGGESVNRGFNSARRELGELTNEVVIDAGGIGHERHQEPALPGVSIELGPVGMEGEFAAGHQEEEHAMFGQSIE